METHSPNSLITSLSEIDLGNETTHQWSDLPKDILTRIISRLDWKNELTRIRGVCPEWRSALQLSEYPLDINSRFGVPPLEPTSSKLNLLHSRFYFFSPLTPSVDDRRNLGGNWVARFFELGFNKRHLFNPFNHQEYFFPEPPLSASFNLLDCRVLELACVFSLFSGSGDDTKAVSKKVVGGLNVNSGYLFAILAKLENGAGLVFWKLGDNEWTRMELTDSFRVLDIGYHHGKFYVFEASGWRIGVIDPGSGSGLGSGMEFIPAPKIPGEPTNVSSTLCIMFLVGCHFVSSDGKLYLILAFKDNVIVFVMKDGVWEHVHNLGDAIFFIGDDASFSLPRSSSNLPQWKPNSICFFSRSSALIFDYSSKGNLPEGAEVLDCINYPMYWRYFSLFELEEPEKGFVPFNKLSKKTYTGLFFPPPPWVKWQCPSRGNADVRLDGLEFHG